MSYCEDFPCCGHTRLDPCPGQGVVMTSEEAAEFYWCDDCGCSHVGACPVDSDEECCRECGEEGGNHGADCSTWEVAQ